MAHHSSGRARAARPAKRRERRIGRPLERQSRSNFLSVFCRIAAGERGRAAERNQPRRPGRWVQTSNLTGFSGESHASSGARPRQRSPAIISQDPYEASVFRSAITSTSAAFDMTEKDATHLLSSLAGQKARSCCTSHAPDIPVRTFPLPSGCPGCADPVRSWLKGAGRSLANNRVGGDRR